MSLISVISQSSRSPGLSVPHFSCSASWKTMYTRDIWWQFNSNKPLLMMLLPLEMHVQQLSKLLTNMHKFKQISSLGCNVHEVGLWASRCFSDFFYFEFKRLWPFLNKSVGLGQVFISSFCAGDGGRESTTIKMSYKTSSNIWCPCPYPFLGIKLLLVETTAEKINDWQM